MVLWTGRPHIVDSPMMASMLRGTELQAVVCGCVGSRLR